MYSEWGYDYLLLLTLVLTFGLDSSVNVQHNPKPSSLISVFTSNIRKAWGLLMAACLSPSWGSCFYNVREEGYNHNYLKPSDDT